jgi:hypothetical protein
MIPTGIGDGKGCRRAYCRWKIEKVKNVTRVWRESSGWKRRVEEEIYDVSKRIVMEID